MNKKAVIKKIGAKRWTEFRAFMYGQTVGIKDGELDYYEQDVQNFMNAIKGSLTFFD